MATKENIIKSAIRTFNIKIGSCCWLDNCLYIVKDISKNDIIFDNGVNKISYWEFGLMGNFI